MIQNIGRHTVRVFGRTVTDGGMLWLLSSLSGIGFRITGARRLDMVLESDDTTADPARKHLTPRFAVLVDGDIVIVEQTPVAENGEVVVALVDGCEATVKTFYREDGRIRLQPENDAMEPIYATNPAILGKVTGLFRSIS